MRNKIVILFTILILILTTGVVWPISSFEYDVGKRIVEKVFKTTNPTATDDKEFRVGTVWLNTTTDKAYILTDNTGGAAVWKDFSLADVNGNVDINGGTIDGATIGGTTPAAGNFTNITATATLGTELISWTDAGWNEDGVTWTFAASTLTHVTGNTTAVTGTVTGALTAGVTYAVAFTGTGGGATATYTLGGVTGTTIAASGAISFTDYITATVDSELVITPSNTCTVALTLVSVKALTDATGDTTIQGNLNVYSPAYLYSSAYLWNGSVYSFINDPDSYLYNSSPGYVDIAVDGTRIITCTSGYLWASGLLAIGGDYGTLLYADSAGVLAQRNSTTAQTFRLYTSYTSGTSYERLGINTAAGSITLAAETLDAGTDNIDIILTPAGTGQVKSTAANITVGSGTGITVNSTGNLNRQVYTVTTVFGAYTDTDTTKGIVIATLPAKTKLVGCYAETTTKYLGGTINAATLEVGITAEGAAEILAPLDVFTAAVLQGDADAEMGTGMTRAAAIQGGYLPSWTGTTAIYATLDSTAGNLDALTQGSTTFYLVTERY